MSAGAGSFLPPLPDKPVPASGFCTPSRDSGPPARRLCAAVLGSPGDVGAVAAAVAAELRRRDTVRAATVLFWADRAHAHPGDLSLPAAIAARALADSLCACGLEASTRGRLAWVSLDGDPVVAAHAVEHALESSSDPVVLAIGGARPPALEAVLVTAELVVLVSRGSGDDGATLRLAADSLPASAAIIPVTPLGGLDRRRAQAGWGSGRRLLPGALDR